MKLPADAIIAPAKIRNYLLVFRLTDDKSKFLAQAGYTQETWKRLESDLREQILPLDAIPGKQLNCFGDVYEIRGVLIGINGMNLRIVTLWMKEYETGQTKFMTLFPDKETV
jgi:hypothetical protein